MMNQPTVPMSIDNSYVAHVLQTTSLMVFFPPSNSDPMMFKEPHGGGQEAGEPFVRIWLVCCILFIPFSTRNGLLWVSAFVSV